MLEIECMNSGFTIPLDLLTHCIYIICPDFSKGYDSIYILM